MDERKTLDEVKSTLENLKNIQETLDGYVVRVEKVITDLEVELYGEKQLTQADINIITGVQPEEELIETTPVKKSRLKFAFFMFLAIISLLISVFTTYISSNQLISFNEVNYIIYKQKNVEPTITPNAFIKLANINEVVENDYVAYYTTHDVIRIKQFSEIVDGTYLLTNSNQLISGTEEVAEDKMIGVVVNVDNTLGNLFVALISFKLLIYILTVLLFVIAFLVL